MKKIIFLVTIISFFCTSLSLAQETVLQLKVSKDRKEVVASFDKERKIFVKNEYFSLTPSYPQAKNPELQRLYDIVVDNKRVLELTSELQKTGNFEDIQSYEVVYTTNNCNNPYPINDKKIIDGTYNNWAIESINARCAWNITQGNPNIVVAIADTEFEQTHEDLENQIIHLSGPISAGNAHGTVVAGVACAETNNNKGICGVGYNSKIAAYRVNHYINANGGGGASSSDIKNAIWAAYLDGRPIINASWTGTGLNSLAAQEITENGTTLVLAAGNTATSMGHASIANIPGVILVSSVDMNNEYYITHARNEYIDLCAPGAFIPTPTVNNSYTVCWGTSVAAPFVAGTIALLLSVNPNLTPAEIETILKNTAAPINNAHLYPGLIGAGRLDAYTAVQAAVCATKPVVNFVNQAVVADTTVINNCGDISIQNVKVQNSTKLTLDAAGEVIFNGDFELQLGSELEIK